MNIEKDIPTEIWWHILDQIDQCDRCQTAASVAKVSKEFNRIIGTYNDYQLAQPIFFKEKIWRLPIHITISNVLNKKKSLIYLDQFLGKNLDLNAKSSNGQTPLLQICDFFSHLLPMEMEDTVRGADHQLLVDCVSKLLQKGADPNLQGFPSTPLVTILAKQAVSEFEVELQKTFVTLLVQHGANPDLVPLGDLYALGQSPREMAADNPIICALFSQSIPQH